LAKVRIPKSKINFPKPIIACLECHLINHWWKALEAKSYFIPCLFKLAVQASSISKFINCFIFERECMSFSLELKFQYTFECGQNWSTWSKEWKLEYPKYRR
jgi:hypothetical protein